MRQHAARHVMEGRRHGGGLPACAGTINGDVSKLAFRAARPAVRGLLSLVRAADPPRLCCILSLGLPLKLAFKENYFSKILAWRIVKTENLSAHPVHAAVPPWRPRTAVRRAQLALYRLR